MGLVVFDVSISVCAFLLPDLWFTLIHGVEYVDPQGFLRRCGANWTAFALVQGIAVWRWRTHPHWLAVVAGVRLSDIFTDWTYAFFSHDLTMFGWVSLLAMSPINLLLGWWFLRQYRQFAARQLPVK